MATTIDRPPAKPKPKLPRPPHQPSWSGPRPPRRGSGRGSSRAPSEWPEPRLARFSLTAGLGVALLAGVAVTAVALVIALSVGSGEPPPATGAAELVPADALLYLHVSTDGSRPAVARALALSRHLTGAPLLFAAVTNRIDAMLSSSDGTGVSYSADVRPWLGREAALAVLDSPGASAGSLLVLDVRDRPAARRFLARVGAHADGTYRGVPLLAESSGAMLAFLRHYLVLGQSASVETAIDVAAGRDPSLAASGLYQRAASVEPDARVLDAYASAAGIRRALVPRHGVLGILGTLLDQPPLAAVTLSVSPAAPGLRVDIHRVFDPRLVGPTGYRAVTFRPTLAGVMPAGSILLLDVHGLRASVPKLLAVAAKAGVLGRIGPLFSRLGAALAAQGVNLRRVLSVFSGETAIALAPAHAGGGPAPVVVTRPSDLGRARGVLAGLELPLTQVFAPPGSGPGQVPEVNDTQVGGVVVHQLALAPGFNLDYAVAHGLVVVSTAPAGIAAVLSPHHALSDAPGFRRLVPDPPDRVTSLVFSDLGQLLRLGSQAGLIGSVRQVALSAVVERIHAVGLASWRGASDTTTQLQLQIP